ncbi:hypothetical protein AB833_14320 [Chromatiales bacterium (ex Bugula neritina AB1)]|nr:hypothetical protein AB833_14320 [Chromatiales bacterium (ex Bugula neritina AB1)]
MLSKPDNGHHDTAGLLNFSWHKRVWLLAVPIILSNITVPLVGAVDTAIVGHLDEVELIGAVALGASIFSLVFWTFGFLRMGTSGMVAQASGAGDTSAIGSTVLRSLLLACILGVAVIALQLPLLSVCLQVFDGSARLDALTAQYYNIRIWSAPATFANYVVLGTLIGLQRTSAVFVFQLFLNLLNIALDLLFVPVLNWGISGVAAASVISEYAALIFSLFLIRSTLHEAVKDFRPQTLLRRYELRKLINLNTNIFVRTLLLVLSFFYFNSASTRLGATTLAANAILMQILHICAYALDGFAHAVETLAGHAQGSKRKTDFHNAVIVSTVQSCVIAIIMSALIYQFGVSLILLFTDQQDVIDNASRNLPWLIALPILSVWCYQLDGIFIGTTRTGEMRNAMVISAFIFVILSELLLPQLNNTALWLAFSLFMVLRAITLLLYFPRIQKALDANAA